MTNSYWVLRHGRSKANAKGLIVSHLDNGVREEFGLTAEGGSQAEAAGHQLAAELGDSTSTQQQQQQQQQQELVIISSPFSRTLQTSQRVVAVLRLEAAAVQVHPALRERYFGAALELSSHAGYCPAWEADAADPGSRPGGDGESVEQVATRLRQLMQELEERYQGRQVLLVSHGDTLSILQTLAAGDDLRHHRRYGLETAQLASMVWQPAAHP